MARKPAPPAIADDRSDRRKIIDAFLELLAEHPFDEIGFNAIAQRSGLTLAQCRAEFGSVLAVLAGHIKDTDRAVLAGAGADMADEPPRERLFDTLMRRLELLKPHKEAMRSLARSAARNPGLAFALNHMAVRSQQWMLTASDIGATGPRGMIRAQGLAMLYARVLRVWLSDDDPGQAPTLAALDRELARGQRFAGMLDDLCRFVPRCRGRRRRRGSDESEAMAAV